MPPTNGRRRARLSDFFCPAGPVLSDRPISWRPRNAPAPPFGCSLLSVHPSLPIAAPATLAFHRGDACRMAVTLPSGLPGR